MGSQQSCSAGWTSVNNHHPWHQQSLAAVASSGTVDVAVSELFLLLLQLLLLLLPLLLLLLYLLLLLLPLPQPATAAIANAASADGLCITHKSLHVYVQRLSLALLLAAL